MTDKIKVKEEQCYSDQTRRIDDEQVMVGRSDSRHCIKREVVVGSRSQKDE